MIKGRLVDLIHRKIFPASVEVNQGRIVSVTPIPDSADLPYLMPGFIDSHIHIESSMLIPSEFARLATVHGTVATVSDPHEIGNVLGLEGIRYMIHNGKQVPFHFYFGAPSCVPATSFETSGANLSAKEIEELFQQDSLHYLSEMMNYPGVLHKDPMVMEKIAIAKKSKKPIDGHAPGLRGEDAKQYIQAGISTDHECFTLEEAKDKLQWGMKIIIREGSAARNYEALHPLFKTHPEKLMFCSDDKHPNDLIEGHINLLVQRSIAHGYDLFDVLRAACVHPIEHYQLDVGLLRKGDSADFILVKDLQNFEVLATYIGGTLVAEKGKPLISSIKAPVINHFKCSKKRVEDFYCPATPGNIRVIEVVEGELITHEKIMEPKILNGNFVSDPNRDLLKLVVVNRYQDSLPAIGFIHRFGLKQGALASCIAHDSHNIICVGTSDEEICDAVNAVIENQGGISVVSNGKKETLPLSVGGIMSEKEGLSVAEDYIKIDREAKKLGTPLKAPFMTLSFMALLVIPSLKLSDKGLFDGTGFKFIELAL